jgi:hypothetical protein
MLMGPRARMVGLAGVFAWIFACARAAKPITEAVPAYLRYREQSEIPDAVGDLNLCEPIVVCV